MPPAPRRAVLMAAGALALALSGPIASQTARHPAESRLAAAVSESALRATVRELVALGPRMGGTASGDRAAARVHETFEGLGLEPRTFVDPPLLAYEAEHWRVELEPGDVLASAWPYGYAPSAGPARGRLLRVGAGPRLQPDASWAGRVAYTAGDPRPWYARLVERAHRPAAIVSSFPAGPDRFEDWSRIQDLPARPDNPVPVFAVSFNDGLKIEEAAARDGVVRFELRTAIGEGHPRTVLATLPGRDASRYYLLSAHGDSDSGGPGADDNASGVAVVIEIARRLADLAAHGIRPRVSIRFAIWGTEYHSARAYIEREGAALAACLGVINVDMVGTGAERNTLYFESNDVPWNEPLLRTLEGVGADYLGRPGFWPEYTTTPSQGGTDAYAFLPREHRGRGYTPLRIPAITVFTAAWDRPAVLTQTPGWESAGLPNPSRVPIDYSRYYHSSGDTPENTTERTPQHMVRAARAVGLALLRLAY